jgi:hypothetical protein
LDNAKRVQSLCEPCGEIKASDVTVSSIEVKATGYQNTYEVLVNGKGIDLAYTFVNGINLGIALSCPAQGVGSSLN